MMPRAPREFSFSRKSTNASSALDQSTMVFLPEAVLPAAELPPNMPAPNSWYSSDPLPSAS